MNIPKNIVDKGGEHLEHYVRTSLKLDEEKRKRVDVEDKITNAFVNMHKHIGEYLPYEDKPSGHGSYYWDARNKKNCQQFLGGEHPIQKVYIVEEILKEVRELTLDIIDVEKNIDKLEKEIYNTRFSK